jgi:methyl-accepting chemotaxis protein
MTLSEADFLLFLQERQRRGGLYAVSNARADATTCCQLTANCVDAGRDSLNFVGRSVEQSELAKGQIEQVHGIVADNAVQMGEIANVLRQQSEAVAEIARGVSSIAEHAKITAGYADRAIAAVGASEKLITDQFADLDRKNIPNYVLHRAKSDHLLWKKSLSEMLVGLNALKPSELSDYHQCRLGKWYDGVKDPVLRGNPAFAALSGPHELVHRHGRAAADRHACGDKAGAQTELAEMERASRLCCKASTICWPRNSALSIDS